MYVWFRYRWKIFETDNIKYISLEVDEQEDPIIDISDCDEKVITFNHSPTFNGTFEIENLFGFDLKDKYNNIIHIPIIKQRKKHKKRRINKKWFKRYGYDVEYVEIGGWKLKNIDFNNDMIQLVREPETIGG